jgi:nicotinamide riboside kinase
VVVCDTTALMTRSTAAWCSATARLTTGPLQQHRQSVHLTLLTALDLPWVADGLQRDGPQVRGPVDAALRDLMSGGGVAWSLVSGRDDARVASALDAATPLLRARARPGSGLFTRLAERDAAQPGWQWVCEKCDAPECEHRLMRSRSGGT